MKYLIYLFAFAFVGNKLNNQTESYIAGRNFENPKQISKLTLTDYEDRVHGIWLAQIIGASMGFPFEHSQASTQWVSELPERMDKAPVDDDWYYEMVAIRAFEKYGIDMTVQQLGQQWLENSCGSWGSSEQARILMLKGVAPPNSGHPQFNKLWFTIGPQFSADVYGSLAPGLPNVAAKMARKYGHINGFAEGTDGAVFVAGMISIAFFERDPAKVVRKAAKLISPLSPYRKCIDQVIDMADKGQTFRQIVDVVEDKWHIEYPATNNAVANGGIVAASVWFGEADFLKTINLAFEAADFEDTDCNAANAAAVIGAMKGTKGIPSGLISKLNDRIAGDKMGGIILTPRVDESIKELAKRTAAIGKKILIKNHVKIINGNIFHIEVQQPLTQEAELFQLEDFTKFWNPKWKLERAGFGGAGGGMGGIRGNTHLDGNILATYPRDEVRGVLLTQTVKINGERTFSFDVGVDSGRVWQLNAFINNQRVINTIIEGKSGRDGNWQTMTIDLSPYSNKTIVIRLYQRVLIRGKEAGNAYWRNFSL